MIATREKGNIICIFSVREEKVVTWQRIQARLHGQACRPLHDGAHTTAG